MLGIHLVLFDENIVGTIIYSMKAALFGWQCISVEFKVYLHRLVVMPGIAGDTTNQAVCFSLI